MKFKVGDIVTASHDIDCCYGIIIEDDAFSYSYKIQILQILSGLYGWNIGEYVYFPERLIRLVDKDIEYYFRNGIFMNCPYCDRELVKDSEHKGVFYCRKYGHHYTKEHIRGLTYIDFHMFNNKNESVKFANKSYYSLSKFLDCVLIEDFSILKGKSFEELQELYNKLRIFK